MAGNVYSLTDEEKDFLKKCEEKFNNRYTEDDESFMVIHRKTIDDPPIVSPWYCSKPKRNRRDDRDERSGRSGDNSGEWSGNRDRHSYRDHRFNNSRVDRDYHRSSDNRHRPYNSRRHDHRQYDDHRHGDKRY